MGDNLTNSMAELNDSVKQYLQAKIDLVKLLLLRKVSKALTFVFDLMVILLLIMLLVAFGGAAFAIWYGLTYGDYLTGVLIVTGFVILTLLVFLLGRKKLLASVFLSNISNILFEEDEYKE